LDALKAHEEERYSLSVPVVLAQLEGMVAEARQHEGRFNTKTLFKYLEPIAARGSRFQRIAGQLVVDTLWVDGPRKAPRPLPFPLPSATFEIGCLPESSKLFSKVGGAARI
jgi:hypothetical protein